MITSAVEFPTQVTGNSKSDTCSYRCSLCFKDVFKKIFMSFEKIQISKP